jgi:ADP-ribose pyrophosphatase
MAQSWKLVGTETVCTDPWGTVSRKTYQTGNGDPDQKHVTVEKPEFALIAALDESRNLLLVRQYRHGTDRSYWALPGGFVDKGETPVVAAQRELLEETGHVAGRSSYIGAFHPVPAFLKTVAHIVVCEDLRKDPLAKLDSEIECTEAIPFDTAIQRVLSGEIIEMQAACAILLVNEFLRQRSRESVRT